MAAKSKIILDFKNQDDVLDKLLPTVLSEASSPEQHVTFEKWLEDNRKVRSIILASKSNDIRNYGVKMLSLMAKLEDFKAGLDKDTYINVIFQSLPPSYDPSIHELINMMVQYEAMNHKSTLAVLVGEATTFKAKGKRIGRWKWKKGKGKAIAATASALSAPTTPMGMGKGKRKVGSSQSSKANVVYNHCQGKGHWKRECAQLLSNPGVGKKQKA
ncbi:UNVERIFIED_CONTAM: hypothetical protein Sindi_1311500 [Sesamum indicum]